MAALVSLLVVLVVSLLVVRIATVALTVTGLSQESARFQARSAFTGAGFTTQESERVVSHPVRRRIVMLLMLLGNAGIVTVVSSLILSFANVDGRGGWTASAWFRVVVLVLGLTAFWGLSYSRWVDRLISRWVMRGLKRWTRLDVRDYSGLLHLAGEYMVAELQVQPGDWLADRTLAELRLSDEGVVVLGVEKPDGRYVGAPRGLTRLEPHDTILLYGRQDVVEKLDVRRAGHRGDREHRRVADEQRRVEVTEPTAHDDEAAQNEVITDEAPNGSPANGDEPSD